jgi:hypothetical protein
MTGHLQRELTIAPFVKQLSGCGLFDRQSAQDERARSEPEILVRILTTEADAGDGIRASKFLLRNYKIVGQTADNRSGGLKS